MASAETESDAALIHRPRPVVGFLHRKLGLT
jgi:hypothetical protein